MKMKQDELIAIANNLTNENLVNLIAIFSERIHLYVGSVPMKDSNGYLIAGELDKEIPACLNGASIQINMEGTFDDSKDGGLIKQLEHVERENKEREVE